jgi:hypothetical protein
MLMSASPVNAREIPVAKHPQRHFLFSFRRTGTTYGATSRIRQSSGSTLMIEAPWSLPVQNVTGVVELSTKTLRMFVDLGRR